MNKYFLTILTFLMFLSVKADEVEVNIEPSNPVKGEVFDVKFKVSLTTSDKPYISFTPVNLEVLERAAEPEYHFEIRGGIGRAKTTKTLTYTYKVVANRGGSAYLKNILVEIGTNKIKHKNVAIKVLSQRKELPKIFTRAEVSSDSVFLGEGVDVRYYVYSLYPVIQTEVKAFPKLNGFIKRFHKPMDTEQAVRVDGKVYRRSLKYSARVYPEKTGSLSIDPLRLVVQYAGGSVNPFGNLGFGFNRFKKKSLNSKTVKINVKPLPVEGLPPSFTGLVGEHEFKLIMNKGKYLVNEAVEAKLEVSGSGALEKMDAPRLFESNALEKFDDKSDFQEVGDSSGRKVFEYTYLARANTEIPERELELAYFSPEDEQYKIKKIIIPAMTIGGTAGPQVKNNTTDTSDFNQAGNLSNDRIFREVPPAQMMSAPLFDLNWNSIPMKWVTYLIYGLVLLVLLQFVEMIFRSFRKVSTNNELNLLYKTVMKSGASYQSIVNLVFMLRDRMSKEADIFKIIDESSLKKSDKKYFVELVKELEANTYSEGQKKNHKNLKASAMRNLKKEIERINMMDIKGDNENEGLKLDSRTS